MTTPSATVSQKRKKITRPIPQAIPITERITRFHDRCTKGFVVKGRGKGGGEEIDHLRSSSIIIIITVTNNSNN